MVWAFVFSACAWFLVPIIVILILMVQLSLQFFLTMWEARSFVDVVENSQEVHCLSAFLSWLLFAFLAGLLFGLLVVSAGVSVSMVFRASAVLTTSVFSPVVQGVAVGSSVLFGGLGVTSLPCASSTSALHFCHSSINFHSLQARVQGLRRVHSQVSGF